jgi:integrase
MTDAKVRDLPSTGGTQIDYFDKRTTGLILRHNGSGLKTWRVRYTDDGRVRSHRLGHFPADLKNLRLGELTVKAARTAAHKFDPAKLIAPPERSTFEVVANDFLKRHVRAQKLRSGDEIERMIRKHLFPDWRNRIFEDIRRTDVTKLLDEIEDGSGPRQADVVLAIVRKMANWYAARSDNYVSPIVRGMTRSKPAERRRKRILTDAEIQELWKATDSLGNFGALVRVILLTAQRRQKVVTMKRDDLAGGIWTIHSEAREKGNAGKILLPEMARKIIEAQPRVNSCSFVFPAANFGRRRAEDENCERELGHFNSFSENVEKLHKMMRVNLPDMERWTLHDLRRTARSLMSRAKVPSDHAERLLGHAIIGVEGTYDRHDYAEEKNEALEKLAALIATILNPPAANIVQLAAHRG